MAVRKLIKIQDKNKVRAEAFLKSLGQGRTLIEIEREEQEV